jgi:hypothetical protein
MQLSQKGKELFKVAQLVRYYVLCELVAC